MAHVTTPVSVKFQVAADLARLLEAEDCKDWNFSDAVTLEINEALLQKIDRGDSADLINRFIAFGGEIQEYDSTQRVNR